MIPAEVSDYQQMIECSLYSRWALTVRPWGTRCLAMCGCIMHEGSPSDQCLAMLRWSGTVGKQYEDGWHHRTVLNSRVLWCHPSSLYSLTPITLHLPYYTPVPPSPTPSSLPHSLIHHITPPLLIVLLYVSVLYTVKCEFVSFLCCS
jgi:hypothetical protein